MPSLVTKRPTTQIWSIQLLFRWFAVTLALKTGIQYIHWTLWFWMIYHQNKVGCKRMSPKDTIETVTFWLYAPSLWPWPWRQHPNLFTWHSTWRWRNTTWRWCNSITTLVTKTNLPTNIQTDGHGDSSILSLTVWGKNGRKRMVVTETVVGTWLGLPNGQLAPLHPMQDNFSLCTLKINGVNTFRSESTITCSQPNYHNVDI